MSDKSIATAAAINVKTSIDISGYFLRDSIIPDININNIHISMSPYIPNFSSFIIDINIKIININFIILPTIG
ncbi:MAG: hypothetical protein FWH53_09325 [Leptospirales bacterium]|nr:hypothetical protein [Leptospirales bacterium]